MACKRAVEPQGVEVAQVGVAQKVYGGYKRQTIFSSLLVTDCMRCTGGRCICLRVLGAVTWSGQNLINMTKNGRTSSVSTLPVIKENLLGNGIPTIVEDARLLNSVNPLRPVGRVSRGMCTPRNHS